MKSTWLGFMGERIPEIRVVTSADLTALEPLLRASFGRDDFEPQDELEVFAEHPPPDWFALYDGPPRGFIRHFRVDEILYLGELYVVPSPERRVQLEHLLRHFVRHHQLPTPTTLRLDVPQTDYELTSTLASFFPTARTKTFARYHLRTPFQTGGKPDSPLSKADLNEVQTILSQLKHYSVPELEHLAQARQLYVHKDNGVKAALHAAPYETGLEVVTLATAPSHLRRGYAAALLKTFLDANPKTDVTLKVNVEKTAAVSLYERMGFIRQDSLTEVWWYLRLT